MFLSLLRPRRAARRRAVSAMLSVTCNAAPSAPAGTSRRASRRRPRPKRKSTAQLDDARSAIVHARDAPPRVSGASSAAENTSVYCAVGKLTERLRAPAPAPAPVASRRAPPTRRAERGRPLGGVVGARAALGAGDGGRRRGEAWATTRQPRTAAAAPPKSPRYSYIWFFFAHRSSSPAERLHTWPDDFCSSSDSVACVPLSRVGSVSPHLGRAVAPPGRRGGSLPLRGPVPQARGCGGAT